MEWWAKKNACLPSLCIPLFHCSIIPFPPSSSVQRGGAGRPGGVGRKLLGEDFTFAWPALEPALRAALGRECDRAARSGTYTSLFLGDPPGSVS